MSPHAAFAFLPLLLLALEIAANVAVVPVTTKAEISPGNLQKKRSGSTQAGLHILLPVPAPRKAFRVIVTVADPISDNTHKNDVNGTAGTAVWFWTAPDCAPTSPIPSTAAVALAAPSADSSGKVGAVWLPHPAAVRDRLCAARQGPVIVPFEVMDAEICSSEAATGPCVDRTGLADATAHVFGAPTATEKDNNPVAKLDQPPHGLQWRLCMRAFERQGLYCWCLPVPAPANRAGATCRWGGYWRPWVEPVEPLSGDRDSRVGL